MKKIFLTCVVIFLFTVSPAFAGWINSSGYACDPNTSDDCVWITARAEPTVEAISPLAKLFKNLTFGYQPFEYFWD